MKNQKKSKKIVHINSNKAIKTNKKLPKSTRPAMSIVNFGIIIAVILIVTVALFVADYFSNSTIKTNQSISSVKAGSEVLGVTALPAPYYLRMSRTKNSATIYWENTFLPDYIVEVYSGGNVNFIKGVYPDESQACINNYQCHATVSGLKSNTNYVFQVWGIDYDSGARTRILLKSFVTLKWYQLGSKSGTGI